MNFDINNTVTGIISPQESLYHMAQDGWSNPAKKIAVVINI